MRLGVIGFDGQRALVTGGGILQLSQLLQSRAQIVMGIGILGLDGKSLLDQADGPITFAKLMGDDAQQMKRDGVIGLVFKNLTVKAFGLGQTPGLMVGDGHFQGLPGFLFCVFFFFHAWRLFSDPLSHLSALEWLFICAD